MKNRDGRVILPMIYIIALTLCLPLNILYFAVASKLCGPDMEHIGWVLPVYFILCGVYFFAVFALGVLNIVQSFAACRKRDVGFCIKGMLIHKYGLVIFFIVNFMCAFLIYGIGGLGIIMGTRGIALIFGAFWLPGYFVLLGITVFLTWLSLVPGGVYGIQVIRLSKDSGKISAKEAFVQGILQFCFLLDVLGAMYLSVAKWHAGKKSACVIGLLYITGIAGCIGLFILIRM